MYRRKLGRVNKTISYEINRPLPLTLQLFHPCFHSQKSQVKFYCGIRLAFVKKDHQIVYRYNRKKYKKVEKIKYLQQVAKRICLKFKIEIYLQD